MLIGERIEKLCEAKKLTQNDIHRRTGLLKVYTSRIENNHVVPSIKTIKKYARALEVPVYRLFYEGDKPPDVSKIPKGKFDDGPWGGSGEDARTFSQFRRHLGRMKKKDRKLLLYMAQLIARSRRSK